MRRRRAAFELAPIGWALLVVSLSASAEETLLRAKVIHTMAGPAIQDGAVLIRDGKIAAVGKASEIPAPAGAAVREVAVITPGLIDAHSAAGLTGQFNQKHDQDQLERSEPVQPELRAIDAYNAQERLVEWVRGFGVTTLHTGHAPGELIAGQTAIVKTIGDTVEDATLVADAAVAATLGPGAQKGDGKSPGTRGKMMAMLRSELIKAQEYAAKRSASDEDKRPERSLRLDALARVLTRELPLLVTANRAQDISSALRLAKEFNLRLILDGAAEAYVLLDEIKAAGVPVILHPTMWRAWGEYENMSFETAAKLKAAGVPLALQSGYEDYVPKTRVVLFEAARAAASGLSFEAALATITIDAAAILGIAARVGSIEAGKDADLALYDGDPFEYTTHCVAVFIDGKLVSEAPR
jgi:imidazolonepropionase-like amidohydrolase